MSRFDWKAAIVQKAIECEGCLLAAHFFRAHDGLPSVPHKIEKLRAEAAQKASYAAWLARSYNRKGVRRVGAA